ncbi:hypothetical protein [Paenibacillus hexagrammi]|uniref:Uncharacterized protein n=1 Tax=Paenibacillus hexagrammi TaxID=2908839 RepID=A0ABY3SHV8_9BACL|nr:hypothetical protein [Paenibacillus sp. YPD9-1]UJF33482.1 hypothetical protein L0M14_28945 [Paenibacillus sp. YPD9-1]
MQTNLLEAFEKMQTVEELTAFQAGITRQGFSGFKPFLDSFTELLKTAKDGDLERIEALLAKACHLFPEPAAFSPSWETVWQQLSDSAAAKRQVLQTVAESEREGEWQIIMDNPHAVQEVVCYPGLSFQDAAYLYAYFRPQLEKSEYIRMQKIQTLIQETGS